MSSGNSNINNNSSSNNHSDNNESNKRTHTAPEQNTINNNVQVSIYPNPFNNSFTIANFNSDNIKLIDIFGALVLEQNTRNIETIDMSTSSLAPGIYFIVLNDGVYHKIIKE